MSDKAKAYVMFDEMAFRKFCLDNAPSVLVPGGVAKEPEGLVPLDHYLLDERDEIIDGWLKAEGTCVVEIQVKKDD